MARRLSQHGGAGAPARPSPAPSAGPAGPDAAVQDDMVAAEGAGISTGALARRLGVSPTTIRSWERRYGIGPERHSPGHHRRYLPPDVERLELMCHLTAQGLPPAEAARVCKRPPGAAPAAAEDQPAQRTGGGHTLPVGPAGALCRGLARAAVRLDDPAMHELLATGLATHGVVATWEELAAPVLRAVGAKWAVSGGRYVEVEHLLSCAIGRALQRVGPDTPPEDPGRRAVLLAAAPEEMHVLPLQALAAALTERGIPVRLFGAGVPTVGLTAAVVRTGPAAVVLWSQSRTSADPRGLAALSTAEWGQPGARQRAALYAAGPGWSGRDLPPGVTRLHSLSQAVGELERPGPAR
ncbi:DNA-binding transcriptional MerR regulator [Kitasatospora herbaricolor]|uniref:MerR family transcriptional regulator n=1 Tax=Kitasatospora herbaricolor TaxID=68217 RepID=UPI001E2F695C|nr:MerR family transcriptional regulator [Kitasatospora herbaricolor]MDQ0313062.1 DNA-binding transcriptional MerR regulator [Kitasatospora herbaricolor]